MQPHASGKSEFDDLRVLASRPDCTEDDLKAAYRRIAQKLHPDHGGDTERFQALQRDYEDALRRLNEPARQIVTVGPTVVRRVRRRSRRRLGLRVFGMVILLILLGMLLPPQGRFAVLVLVPALMVFLIVPLTMASWKPHVSGIIFLLSAPVLLAAMVGIGSSDPFVSMFTEEGGGVDENYILLSFLATLPALFASTLIGMLFSMLGRR